MSLHRNISAIPLDVLPDGAQLFPGDDAEFSDPDLKSPVVAAELERGALAPVTITSADTPDKASAPQATSGSKTARN